MGKVIDMPGAATLPVAQPRPSKPASRRGGPKATATWREVLEWGGWTERERAAFALAKAARGAKAAGAYRDALRSMRARGWPDWTIDPPSTG